MGKPLTKIEFIRRSVELMDNVVKISKTAQARANIALFFSVISLLVSSIALWIVVHT